MKVTMSFDLDRIDGPPVEKQFITAVLGELIDEDDEIYVDDTRYRIGQARIEYSGPSAGRLEF